MSSLVTRTKVYDLSSLTPGDLKIIEARKVLRMSPIPKHVSSLIDCLVIYLLIYCLLIYFLIYLLVICLLIYSLLIPYLFLLI